MAEELTKPAQRYAEVLSFIDMLDRNLTDGIEKPHVALLQLFGYVQSQYLIPELPEAEVQAVYKRRREPERTKPK